MDRFGRTVSGQTPHFSVFSLFATASVGKSLTQARVYPDPWKRGSGGRYDATRLTFDRLPRSGAIRVMSLAGDLIRELDIHAIDAGIIHWDGRNTGGHEIASGVYFAIIRSDSGEDSSVIKFALER
jgi:hypothetical protein